MEIDQARVEEGPLRVGAPGAPPLVLMRACGAASYLVPEDPADLRRFRVVDAATGLVARPFRGQVYLARARDYDVACDGRVLARIVRDRGAREAKCKGVPAAFDG